MKCVLCGNTKFIVITNKLRNNIPLKVVKCKKFSLISLENPLKIQVDYSKKKYRKLHSPVLKKVLSPKEMFDSQIQFQKNRISCIRHLLKPKSTVLEIGSSTGHFLFSIKDMVKNVVGIELEPRHAEFSRNYCKIEVYDKPLEQTSLKFQQFDIIFMFQVFEHIPNPLEFLLLCKKYLKPNGIIYIETPNVNDVLLSVYDIQSFREFYYREPHAYYYSIESLQKMLKKCGFVGNAKTIQEYTLFNHLHWLLTKKPQLSQSDGYNRIKLTNTTKNGNASPILEKWFSQTNTKYQRLLEKCGLAQHVCYIGKMS